MGQNLYDWTDLLNRQHPLTRDVEALERMEELGARLRSQMRPWDWAAWPGWVQKQFAERGWEWNGYYVRTADDMMRLGHAAGPPVCGELERLGGPGSSGMCWDAVLLSQPLVTSSVKDWPGYVSCDGASGLKTAAGAVIPLRASDSQILGVWDLDSSQPLDSADVTFVSHALQVAQRLYPPSHEELGGQQWP